MYGMSDAMGPPTEEEALTVLLKKHKTLREKVIKMARKKGLTIRGISIVAFRRYIKDLEHRS